MEPVVAGLIGFGVLFLLIFLGLPIGFAMLLVGFTGLGYLTTMSGGLSVLGVSSYVTTATYTFCVIPLFVLMGLLCSETGLITELYNSFYKWIGHFPGGLALATIGGCAALAATTGSSVACAAAMGKISMPEMRRYNYDNKLAAGTVAAGGTLGILIPPSGGFIFYGIITNTSIGKLFIAGILPGILLSLLFMVTIFIRAKLNPSLASPGPKASSHERLTALKGSWLPLVLFILVMGSIYMGLVTPTEAGAVGAFFALIIALTRRKLTKERLSVIIKDTMKITGMVFVILIGAMVFNYLMAVSQLPFVFRDLMAALPLSPYLILLSVIIILFFLGCVMDTLAMILLTMPIFFPLITTLGFDPIWFGVIAVITMEAGLISPPIGMNVFVVAGLVPDVPLYDVFQGILPFLLTMFACIIILAVFPQIALILPYSM